MRIVIKIGTSTLTHASGNLNIHRVEQLCKIISDITNAGHQVILVSSGAIGMGVGKLGLKERPKDIPGKQAAAAVGQCELMYFYDKLFSEYNHTVAQILITDADFKDEKRYNNFTNTVTRLIEMGCIPVLNENDTVSTEEIALGDNDTLAGIAAVAVGAHLLVLLTDVDGLYNADPNKNKKAKLISVVDKIDSHIEELASGATTRLGTGGMTTKINAAKIVTDYGCDMIIANGSFPTYLYDIVNGKSVGTRFIGKMRESEKGVFGAHSIKRKQD